jgi:RNA polymerase sigma factor (sigma-70 family)
MLFHADETQLKIARVVDRVTRDADLRRDLLQEALLHFWQKESELPGQTLSYYLQSCHFHLLDYLRHGRSLDSPTRSHLRAELDEENDEEGPLPAELTLHENASDSTANRDLLQVIAEHVDEVNRRILLLAERGAGVREISRQLGISHPAVVKRFRTIRVMVRRLGFHP